jgi:endonuclease-3
MKRQPARRAAAAKPPKKTVKGANDRAPGATGIKLRAQAARVVERLNADYPRATCALVNETPFELLVATILSAQCTDARVNMVTP